MRQFLITLLLFPGISLLFGQETDPGKANYKVKAEALITEVVAEGKVIGIAAGFSRDGGQQWKSASGFSNKDGEVKFTTETKSRIASVTKPMTAIAIMQLVEQGKINLDDKFQKYFPNYPVPAKGAFTIGQIVKHGTGINGYTSNKERENKTNYATLEEAAGIFMNRELLFAPGTDFNYTSYGYTLLGMVIEKVSGMSFEDYLKKNIWDKAGMNNTLLYKQGISDVSATYHKNSKGKVKAAKPTNLSDRLPAGGVLTTLNDMLKFGDAILNGSLISQETFNLMTQDSGLKKVGNPYGLGWYLYGKNPKYGQLYGHNGAQTGSSAWLMLLPEVKTSVVVMSNTSGALDEVGNISVKLFDIAAMSNDH